MDPTAIDTAEVRGFLHNPTGTNRGGLVLAHGAGGNCDAPVLVAAARGLAAVGLAVLRIDLPFRRKRPSGPPPRGSGAADRDGLRRAVTLLRTLVPGPIYLGGHSYGGRQATLLAAEDPSIADALLLFSYPLHPPKRPEQLRTEHFTRVTLRAVFVHGSTDPFGSRDELAEALALIPARTTLIEISGAGHDLKRGRFDLAPIAAALLAE